LKLNVHGRLRSGKRSETANFSKDFKCQTAS
jgi:hypothetical protein